MIKEINSKENKTIKELAKLKTRKGRTKAGMFIVDGYRIVKHAIENASIECVIVADDFLNDHPVDFEGTIYKVPLSIMKTLVETETPQGIIAIVHLEEKKINEGPVLFLDQIQDPGNMGTLIRSADAAGFKGVMLRKGCTDPYSQKSLRSSMGSIMSIPLVLNQTVEDLEHLNYELYGAALEGGKPFKEVTYQKNGVLIIGNEGNGISKEVLDIVDKRVYIPMKGDVESLNASIAGGILMFEIASCV